MSSKLRIMMIMGSTRDVRAGIVVGDWIHSELKKIDSLDIDFYDLKEKPLPFLGENPDHPHVLEWKERTQLADGYVFITPEYNHSISGVLKNAIDSAHDEYRRKAASLVSYSSGQYGGVRATEHLRQILAELQVVPIKEGLHIGYLSKSFDPDGKPVDSKLSILFSAMSDSLIWWVTALKSAREQ